MATLKIKNLHVSVEEKEILKGLNLTINTGEIHAIMGPNGTGKSTLAAAIMGHPSFVVTAGEIWLDEENVLEMEVDERARAGLFLAVQYPSEISGVTNAGFIRAAMNAQRDEADKLSIREFITKLDEKMALLDMPEEMAERYLNEGFSGGEKKRNEILQMLMIEPKFAILDEIDSGLDIDALEVVSNGINEMRGDNFGSLIITHYQRLLNYVVPDFVHIVMDLGYIQEDPSIFIEPNEINNYEPHELLFLCTGSQGEPMAALSRIANGTHRQISIVPGDTVIFSSSPIPGNTNSVNNLINQLAEAGANIVHGKMNNIHTSGHGAQQELKLMLRLMKPKFFVPIHGERRMQHEHVELAVQTGVDRDHTFILDNGEILAFNEEAARRAGEFNAQDVYIDGSGIGDIGNVVLSDRRILSDNGLVVVVATIDTETRKILAGPDIISRGFIYMRESGDLIRKAQQIAEKSLDQSFSYKQINEYKMRNDLIEDLKEFLYKETERKPMILPVVLTTDN